jgi:hypothetical protein
MKIIVSILLCCVALFVACKKNDSATISPSTPPAPNLVFKFKFDSTQVRLNNFGQAATMPAGHSGQSPRFNLMSAHYIELAQDSLTLLGKGDVLYNAPVTTAGGASAIDFSKSSVVGDGAVFFSIPLSQLAAGTYKWLRVSLAYQNYNITMVINSANLAATVASFIGYDTYISSYNLSDTVIAVNSDKLQGYWALETNYLGFKYVTQGQAPPGATTVPNPISSTSPIPAGSCVVTGAFTSPLIITGSETRDINITVSLSTNKSFEWKDANMNGLYEPANGDTVVDMGIRGLIPIVQ